MGRGGETGVKERTERTERENKPLLDLGGGGGRRSRFQTTGLGIS